jgi:DNA-binding NtrC family response regulator
MKHSIMFVDNDSAVLESVRWVLMDEPYYVFSFENPVAALSVLDMLDFAVVLAEHSMLQMDGVKFLKKAKKVSPNTPGIIITGYNEPMIIKDALAKGYVFSFIKKPWDHRALKQALEWAVVHYEENSPASPPTAS